MTEQLIAACGLVCSECEAFVATRAGDADAIRRLAERWSAEFGVTVPAASVWCDGCMVIAERRGAHVDDCEVRDCVLARGLTDCSACDLYVCDMLEEC